MSPTVVALRRIGIIENERSLRNKIARSTFSGTVRDFVRGAAD